MPPAATIRRWLRDLRNLPRRLRPRPGGDRADILADEIIEIADRAEGPTAARLPGRSPQMGRRQTGPETLRRKTRAQAAAHART